MFKIHFTIFCSINQSINHQYTITFLIYYPINIFLIQIIWHTFHSSDVNSLYFPVSFLKDGSSFKVNFCNSGVFLVFFRIKWKRLQVNNDFFSILILRTQLFVLYAVLQSITEFPEKFTVWRCWHIFRSFLCSAHKRKMKSASTLLWSPNTGSH